MQSEINLDALPNLENYLHFGSTVYIQIGDVENNRFYLCSDGFIIRNIFVVDFKENNCGDFSSCLFLIVPTNHYEIQKSLQQKIKLLESSGIQTDNFQDKKSKENRDNFVKELEYEINEGVDNFYKVRGMPISYGNYFQLFHLRTSKYLSFISTSQDANFVEGFSYFLEDIPSEKSVFTIDPCYKYQQEVNQYVSFNDFQYLTCQIEGKDCHLYWNQGQGNDKQMQTSVQKQESNLQDINDNFSHSLHELNLSVDKKSFIKFNCYSSFIDEGFKYLCQNDIVWICLESKDCYLKVKDTKNNSKNKNSFLSILLAKLSLFILQYDIERFENQDNPWNHNLLDIHPLVSLENSSLQHKMSESQTINNQELLQYEHSQEQQSKNNLGMWKIEGINQNKGGKLEWTQRIRLINVKTGLYLAIGKEYEQMNQSLDPSFKDAFQVTLQELGDENTLFVLKRIGDTVEKYIEASSCFYIKHDITQQYLSSQQLERKYEMQSLQRPVTSNRGFIENAFHFQKAQKLQDWETFFLLSCSPLIQHGIDVLQNMNKKNLSIKDGLANKDEEISLLILKDCIVELQNFCQDDSENGSDNIEIDKRMRFFRQISLREQGYIKHIIMVLQQSTNCTKYHFSSLKDQGLKQNSTLSDKLKRQTKYIGFNTIIKKPQLLQQLFQKKNEDKNESIKILLIIIAQSCYDLIKNICKDNVKNQEECFLYFRIFQDHLGLEIGAESCIISILKNNEKLLLKIHTIDLSKSMQIEEEYVEHKKFEDVLRQQGLIPHPKKKEPKNLLYLEKIQGDTLVHCFVEKFVLKLKSQDLFVYHVEMFEFFNAITHNPQTLLGITINQLLIIDLLQLEEIMTDTEKLSKASNNKNSSSLLIPITAENGLLMIEVEDIIEGKLKKFELSHAFSLINSTEFKVKDRFESFIQLQLMLFGNLCYGRNYFSKQILKERFSCKLLLQYITNISLPPNIKAALLYILMCTHLDSKPRKLRIVPNLVHKMDLVKIKEQKDEFNQDQQKIEVIERKNPKEKVQTTFAHMKSMLIKKQQKTSDSSDKFIASPFLRQDMKSKTIEEENTFAGIKVQNMVDGFLDDEDTISPDEMKQLKQYVLKYLQEEMYALVKIKNGKSLGQIKKIKYNFLTLQMVTVLHKLLQYDCFVFIDQKIVRKRQSIPNIQLVKNQKLKKQKGETAEKEIGFEFWEKTFINQDEFNLLILLSIVILEDEEEQILFKDQAHKSIMFQLRPTDASTKKRTKESLIQDQETPEDQSNNLQNLIKNFFDEEKQRKKRVQTEVVNNSQIQEFKIDNLLQNSQLSLKRYYLRLLEEQDQESLNNSTQAQKEELLFDKINLQYEVDVKKEILLVLLHYIDIRREKDIEIVVEMLEKLIKREDLFLVDENTLNSIIEDELELFIPSIMLTGLSIIDDELRTIDEMDPFDKIIQNKPLLPVLYKVFYKSKNQELSELSLKLIFKCYSMRKNLMKSIKGLQLLSDPKEIALYDYLQGQSRTLKFLVEKTEIWLGTPDSINSSGFKYKFVIYQFLDIVKEFTNVMYSNVDVESFLLINKPLQKHDKDIMMNRQNILKILNIHDTILELLKGNAFLLQDITQRTPENILFLSIFESCFQFLKVFCSINNLDNKKKVYNNIDIILFYLDIIELGQIDLINTIFKNNNKSNKNLDEKLVKQVMNKIIPIQIHLIGELNKSSIIDEFHMERKQSFLINGVIAGLQFHPRYLQFFQNIMYFKGVPQKENIKIVLNTFMQGGRFREFLFLKENQYHQKQYDGHFLEPSLAYKRNKKSDRYQKLGKYIFDLKIVPSQLEFNLPFIYHARILNLINTFVINLEDGIRIITNCLQNTITLSYLFFLLSKKTIYQEDNLHTFLNFILKLEVLQVIQNVWLKMNDKNNVFDFKNDINVDLWLKSEKISLAKQFQQSDEPPIFKDSFESKLFKIINKGQPVTKSQNKQKPDIGFFQDEVKPRHKTFNKQSEDTFLLFIEQNEYQRVEYMVYIFENLIPFIINIYNFYMIKDKSSTQGNIKALHDFVIQDLKQFISQIHPEKFPQMSFLIKKRLKALQNIFKVSFLTLHVQSHDNLFVPFNEMDDSHKSSNEGEIQVELIELPLQNLIHTQSANSKFEDFAWKCTVVNILLNQTVKKTIEEERLTLVKSIKNISDYVYKEIQGSSLQKKVKRINLNDFLNRIVKFVQNEIEKYLKNPSSGENLNVVFECLVLLTDLLNMSAESIDKKEKENMQNILNRSQILTHGMNFICDENFTPSNSKMRKFFNIFIQLSIAMLDGGNLDIQNGFYEYFVVNTKSESFFLQIQARMNEERNKKHLKQTIYDRIQQCLKRVEFCYQPFDNKDDLKHLLRFLQLLCENHNTKNQNWLRQQNNSRNSIDFMNLIALILKANLKKENSTQININMSNFHTIISCLEFLTEMIQGPCYENQMSLSEGSFLDTASQILKENDSVAQRKTYLQSHLSDSRDDSDSDQEHISTLWSTILGFCTSRQHTKKSKLSSSEVSLYKFENQYNQTRYREYSNKTQTGQILKYFEKTSALYARKFEKQYNASQIQYLWMISRTKYKCLQVLESLFEGNTSVLQRKRIMQSIPQSYLMINLIWNFENFQEEKKGFYGEELFASSQDTDIDENEPQDVLVIQSGFKLLYFLKLYEEDNLKRNDTYQNQETNEFNSFKFILSGFLLVGSSLTSWGTSKVSKGLQMFKFMASSDKQQDTNIHNVNVQETKDSNEILRRKFQVAYDFYSKYTLHVDILRDNILYETYFPKLPRCDYLTEEIKLKFNGSVDRSTINAKVQQLQDQSVEINDQLEHEYSQMKQLKLKLKLPVEKLPAYFQVLQSLSFFCSFIQNILILYILGGDNSIHNDNFVRKPMQASGNFIGLMVKKANINPDENGSVNHIMRVENGLMQKIAHKRQMDDLGNYLLRLQQFQIVVACFLVVYVLYKVLPLQRFKYRKELKKMYSLKKPKWMQNLFFVQIFITHFIIAVELNYYQAYILFSVLGYFNPLFSAVLLLDIFKRFPVARQIIMAVKKPYDNILVTLIIFIIFSYFFTLIIYFNYWQDVSIAPNGPLVCTQLLSCFIFIVDQTFKQNGGFTSFKQNDTLDLRVFFDFAYVFIVVILITQIIAGIIIDTFAALREEDKVKKNDQTNVCFICGYDRQTFDRLGDKRGFTQHIFEDHNLYNYIFYISYINHKSVTELTGIESYVRQCLDDNDTQWFPLHRTKGLDQGKIINEESKDEGSNEKEKQDDNESQKQIELILFKQVQDMNNRLDLIQTTIEQAIFIQNEKAIEINNLQQEKQYLYEVEEIKYPDPYKN